MSITNIPKRVKQNNIIKGSLTVGGEANFLQEVILNKEAENPLEAVNKSYVDSIHQGIKAQLKDDIRVATTTNESDIDLDKAPTTIDGVSLNVDNKVLVKNGAYKSSTEETSEDADMVANGIYKVNSINSTEGYTVLTRDPLMDSDDDISAGLFLFVEEGNENAENGYMLKNGGSVTLNNSPLEFVKFTRRDPLNYGPALNEERNIGNRTVGIVESAITDALIGTRNIDESIVPVDTGNLATLLGGIANTIKDIKGTSWKVQVDADLTRPDSVSSLTLNDTQNKVEISFDIPSNRDNVSDYEVWRAIENQTGNKSTHYELIKLFKDDEIDTTTITFTDTLKELGNVKYKVFASNHGIRSSAVKNSVDITDNILEDVENFNITSSGYFYDIRFDIPKNGAINSIVLKKDAKSDTSNISEADAEVIYQGFNNGGYVYEIPEDEMDLNHQFWAYSQGKYYNLDISKIKLNAETPKEMEIVIPPNEVYDQNNFNVYKLASEEDDVIREITSFDNSDKDDFEDNEFVEFDGTMHLQTNYQQDMVDEGTLGEGKMWSQEVDLSKYKTINNIEVV